MSKKTIYQIAYGEVGILRGRDGMIYFLNEDAASTEAKAFKEDPRCHNSKMYPNDIKYWKEQTYRIEKVITTIEILKEI